MPKITFQPMDVELQVERGTTVLEAAIKHDIFLRHTCGSNAMCATCRCTVVSGDDQLSPMEWFEEKRLRELYAPKDVRLSCQAKILGDVVVKISVPTLGF